MNATRLFPYVNQTGSMGAYPLRIYVRTIDARVTFGKLQVLVTPVAGEGEQWIDAGRVAFNNDELNG